jgi:SseB protein C-terminal domain
MGDHVNSQVVSKGQQIFLGKPAKPLPQDRVEQLRALVAATPGISEAHLPQCFIPGSMDSAAQVLFVVLAPGVDGSSVMEQLGHGITGAFSGGEHLDIIPLNPGDPLIVSVRDTGCSLGTFASRPKERPWWRVW